MKKSKAARRNAVLNVVMVAAIVLIVAAGVLAVGSFKGWFDAPQPEVIVQSTAQPAAPEIVLPESTKAPTVSAALTAEDLTGFANITRKGVSYALEGGTKLRDGDIIETLSAASVVLTDGETQLTLDENARVTVMVDEGGMVSLELHNGGLFAEVARPFALTLGGESLTVSGGVFAASAPYGSAGVYMLAGEGTLGDVTITAGTSASIVAGEVTLGELKVSALNAFELAAARSAAGGGQSLCFTVSQLDEVESAREQARQQALEAQLLAEQSAEDVERDRQENEQKVREQLAAQNQTVTGGESGNLDYDDIVVQKSTCTIEIRCDTILDNMDKLAEGKNAYVPANGCILAASRVSFDEGETAYDVLRRACELAGIALEASWTPMYNSYYIEGIGNLYEFDCGEQSGWTYTVNGWFPNYSASGYTLSDGDSIVFLYSCEGYGADVGGGLG